MARVKVPCRHQAHGGSSHAHSLLLLVVRVLEEVSLLSRVVSKRAHHARHLVSCLHLVARVDLHRLALRTGLLGCSSLLVW